MAHRCFLILSRDKSQAPGSSTSLRQKARRRPASHAERLSFFGLHLCTLISQIKTSFRIKFRFNPSSPLFKVPKGHSVSHNDQHAATRLPPDQKRVGREIRRRESDIFIGFSFPVAKLKAAPLQLGHCSRGTMADSRHPSPLRHSLCKKPARGKAHARAPPWVRAAASPPLQKSIVSWP